MEEEKGKKKEVKISKTQEMQSPNNNTKNKKNDSYSKLTNESNIETDNIDNDNDIELEIDNDISEYFNREEENLEELTKSQIERLNQIREETQQRSERYSDSNLSILIKNSDSLNSLNKTNETKNVSKNVGTLNIINNNKNEEMPESEDINPNIERNFNRIHPFLFIKNEPLILIGPDLIYFIIIFTISSFFSIIVYSMKVKPLLIMKGLYIIGYIFYSATYILLVLLNPGIPKNKNNIDMSELKKNYNQCNICNCIFYKNNDYVTFHCNDCNICIDNYDHHCIFASKCIGKNNKFLFKLWLFSVPCFIIIIFLFITIQ